MNRIYRSIWNEKTGTFVAVSENANSAGKKASSCTTASGGSTRFALKAVAVSLMMAFGGNIYALPVGGVVTAGGASISSGPGSMTVTQSTPNAAINWQSFNIGQAEGVRFVQPTSNSVALNRVMAADPSSIMGSLSANGKVFLVNPNGILFGKGAQVNVGGLVASTLGITDSDFMAGRYNFSGAGNGSILNEGSINADGGYVALLGANVNNQGVISAKLGTVALAAGNAITLDVAGDGLLNVTVNQGAVNTLIENGGLIQADGGQVLLTAQAAGSLLQSAVNNTGVIQAQTIENRNGTIKLMGDMQSGTVNVGGTLDASAPNGGNGGFIETSAAHVKVADNVIVTTRSAQGNSGTWLIDPQDFTIGTDVAGITVQNTLAGGSSVTISTLVTGVDTATNYYGATAGSGDINVNAALTWSTAATLTLSAFRNVNVNADMTTTGGNITMTATGAANLNQRITTTNGNLTVTAGSNINVNGTIPTPITTTDGLLVLRAGNDGTGVGTVVFGVGTPVKPFTVSGVDPTAHATIYYYSSSYPTPTDFLPKFALSGGATLTANLLVPPAPPPPPPPPPDLTVKASDVVKTYGETYILTAFTSTGLLGGQTIGSVTETSPGAVATASVAGGPYVITASNATGGTFVPSSYTIHYVNGTLIVVPTGLTLAASNVTKTYGQTPTLSAFSTAGLLNGETVGSVAETSSGALATASVAGGPYAITPSNATGGSFTASNYTIGYVNGALTVIPAGLTVTASNVTKAYGQTPTLSGFITAGLLNGETVGSVAETSPGALATASVVGSPYAITPSNAAGGSFTPSNYTIAYVNGTLTVIPAALTVTASNVAKSYGQTPTLSAFTTAGLMNGETVGSVTETSPGTVASASVAGSPYAITPSNATGGSFTPSNYTIAYVNGVLTVIPIGLTVTATDASKAYGETRTLTAFTTTGLVNSETVGSATLTSADTALGAAVASSTYPITPSSATGGTFTASNYVIKYVDGVLTVTPRVEVVPIEVPVLTPATKVVVLPPWMPTVVLADTPPIMLALLPEEKPLVLPAANTVEEAPAAVPEQAPVVVPAEMPPKTYVPPHRRPKQDRN